ncbi:MAG TPA: PhzF family phenazine biosynthesis protein [Gemmatimonadales bacterium]
MPTYTFHQLDVFTTKPLAGNPLAVFPDADGLDPATMQALAREMNLSETTFVTPSPIATKRVRFFTPTAEIPLAGHPTIGTWWLLGELGLLAGAPPDGTVTVTQETGRAVLPVDVTFRAGTPREVVMTQARPEFGPVVDDVAALDAALGGDGATVAGGPRPQVVSTALPQMMIPIQSRPALRALPSGGAGAELSALLRRYGTDCAMCYAPVESVSGGDLTVACRMFAPGLGIPEDPATGSAAGALGAFLVRHAIVPIEHGAVSIQVQQGHEIDRPSRIRVEIEGTPRDITRVRVGGSAVRVITGEVSL